MGCDIHLSVEYRRKTNKHRVDDFGWDTFGGIAISYSRNYNLFHKMNCNVWNPDDEDGFEERGLPEDINFLVKDANTIYVSETGADGCCTRSDAEWWVSRGTSKWTSDDKSSVTNPDWHSHSWLTYNEFQECVNECCDFDVYDIQWHALVGAMEVLNANQFEVRVVFWFDNDN